MTQKKPQTLADASCASPSTRGTDLGGKSAIVVREILDELTIC